MRAKLKKIGNSKWIILPKNLLEQYQFEEEVEIETRKEGLMIIPVKTKPRQGWEEQFKEAIKSGQKPDAAMLEGFCNQFDKED